MAKRTCEICGRLTDEADFSKSYKHRCKECVAREARKARATKTGAEGETEYIRIPGTCLDETPDWEQRRYEIALAMFASPYHLTAEEAVMNADELIEALKNERP